MSKVSKEFSEAVRMKNNPEEVLERIDWASNTHKDKMMFGLDELGASTAREHRLHGVLMESRKFIIAQGQELQKTREQLEVAEAVLSVQRTDSALAYFKDKQGKQRMEKALRLHVSIQVNTKDESRCSRSCQFISKISGTYHCVIGRDPVDVDTGNDDELGYGFKRTNFCINSEDKQGE